MVILGWRRPNFSASRPFEVIEKGNGRKLQHGLSLKTDLRYMKQLQRLPLQVGMHQSKKKTDCENTKVAKLATPCTEIHARSCDGGKLKSYLEKTRIASTGAVSLQTSDIVTTMSYTPWSNNLSASYPGKVDYIWPVTPSRRETSLHFTYTQ